MIIKTKMHWYITSVQKNNNEWIIQGIQEEHGILDCIITRTNLQDELVLNIEYNEGIGLCVISHQEVYRIEIEIDNHLNKWLDRDKLEKVSADEARYFDGEYYMGLPVIVFCFWKGMINTEI